MQLSAARISVILALGYCAAATDAQDVRATVEVIGSLGDLESCHLSHFGVKQSLPLGIAAFCTATLSLSGALIPDIPVQTQESIHLQIEYLWDPTSPEEWQAIGRRPGGLILGEPGELFIADSRLARILLVDNQGGLIQEIGRQGSGPGEFREPRAITYDRPSHTLWVADIELLRCSSFVRKRGRYEFRHSFRMTHIPDMWPPVFAAADSTSLWLMNRVRSLQDEYRMFIYSATGQVLRKIAPAQAPEPPWQPYGWNSGYILTLTEGRIAYVWHSQPMIEIWSVEGELLVKRQLQGPLYDMPPPIELEGGQYGFPLSFNAVCYDRTRDLLFLTAKTSGMKGLLFVGIDSRILEEATRYYLPEQGEEGSDPLIRHLVVDRVGETLQFFGIDERTLCLVRLFPTEP